MALTVTILADGQGWALSSVSSFIGDLIGRDGLISVRKRKTRGGGGGGGGYEKEKLGLGNYLYLPPDRI